MTTAQAAPNGHSVPPPPPSSLENPAELNSADLPANQDHINSNIAPSATNSDLVQPSNNVVEPKKAVGITAFFRPEEVERQKVFAANVYAQDELRGV